MRGKKPHLLALPFALVALLALAASPAIAAKTHRRIATVPINNPLGIAIDETSGNLLVADGPPGNSVDVFGAAGGAPSGVAAPLEGLSYNFGEGGIAVDNSLTSPSRGALYVVESRSTVKKFTLNPLSEKYELEKELTASPPLKTANNVAVDPEGNVFVTDKGDVLDTGSGDEAVVEFSPSGAQIARLDISASVGAARSVAVDSLGDLFLAGYSKQGVYRFTANASGEIEAGTEPEQIVEPVSSASARGVALDPSTDALYVAVGDQVSQYAASCVPEGAGGGESCIPEGRFGVGLLVGPARVAVNAETGRVYVAERNSRVSAFGPTVIVPGAVTGAATNITGTSATLTGSVDPSGSELDECRFEWGLSATYEHVVPCAETPAEIGAGNASKPVHADVPGLGIGTEYHFRLVATSATTLPNENGPSEGADEHFFTRGPQVHAESVSRVSNAGARLEGLVNPEAEDTSYVFQYVSEADFNESEYAKAVTVPPGGEAIGSGSSDVAVAQVVGGLQPRTTYHFRIVATNASGAAEGPGRFFTTYPEQGAGLPDGRAYEQATAVDKGGTNPRGEQPLVQAASGGNGITFFATGGIPGSEGAQGYPSYLASRSSDNWSTQGLLPPASNGSSASVRGWSEDLSQIYVTQADLPFEAGSLYQRDSATHAMRVISDGVEVSNRRNAYAGASADGSKVLLEIFNTPPLPGGAAKGTNTYVWDRASGTLTLAGVLNTGKAPTGGTVAGSYLAPEDYPSTYALYERAISANGSRVFFTSIGTHQLYLRQNPTAAPGGGPCTVTTVACTVQVSLAEQGVSDPNGPQPANLALATTDGSQVFFISPGKLTANATTGPGDDGSDLYRYDVESGDLTDLTPFAGAPNGAEVQGVLGASGNGSYVYFVANGVLAAGATPGNCSRETEALESTVGNCNLYVWHDGDIAFIAPQHATGTESPTNDAMNWVRKPNLSHGQRTARVTDDGRVLLFRSQEKLTSFDNQGFNEIYRYEAEGNDLACVTCNPTGAAPLGSASLQSIRVEPGQPPPPASILTRNLSADGNRVFFDSPDKLVAGDTNGDEGCPPQPGGAGQTALSCQDVYEWEANGTGSCRSEEQNGGCLYLISSGTSSEASYFGDASVSGDDAFIFTSQPLVAQDKDELVDIYDARVGGGIAAQNQSQPPICSEEACRPGVTPRPVVQAPGSASFVGPHNLKPLKCRKGFEEAKRHGKTVCVKKKRPPHRKKKHHSARKHRRAAR